MVLVDGGRLLIVRSIVLLAFNLLHDDYIVCAI